MFFLVPIRFFLSLSHCFLHFSFLPSFLSFSFLPSLLPALVPSCLPSSLSSFLPSSLSSFLPSFLPSRKKNKTEREKKTKKHRPPYTNQHNNTHRPIKSKAEDLRSSAKEPSAEEPPGLVKVPVNRPWAWFSYIFTITKERQSVTGREFRRMAWIATGVSSGLPSITLRNPSWDLRKGGHGVGPYGKWMVTAFNGSFNEI